MGIVGFYAGVLSVELLGMLSETTAAVKTDTAIIHQPVSQTSRLFPLWQKMTDMLYFIAW